MGRGNLLDLVTEEEFEISDDLQEIKERALQAKPRFLKPIKDDVKEALLMIDLQAEEFAERHYKMLCEYDFTKFLEVTTPYIKNYLTEHELHKIKMLFEWGLNKETDKEQIFNVFLYGFITNRLSFIKVDKELFKNHNYNSHVKNNSISQENNEPIELKEKLKIWLNQNENMKYSVNISAKVKYRRLSTYFDIAFNNKKQKDLIDKYVNEYGFKGKDTETILESIKKDIKNAKIILEKKFNWLL